MNGINNPVATTSLSDHPLPELIKKIRKTNNLTQASFGQLFQPTVTQPTVARWEKGEQVPDRIHFPKIASFLHITFEELLELIEAPTLNSSLKIENTTLTPNKRHLSLLNRGVIAWNQWRLKNPDAIPDLAGANAFPSDLSAINLTDANLSGLNLSRTDLSSAQLVRANLSGASFHHVDFSHANLSGANLSGAILTNCSLSQANLQDANLSHANLSSTDLRNANLNRVNLEYAELSSSYVYGVSVWNIKLEGAVQTQLNICPEKTPSIYVDDLRFAYLKSLALAHSEATNQIATLTQDFQAALEAQNKRFQELFHQINQLTGEQA